MNEIGAQLHHLALCSPQADACAAFYSRLYGMQVRREGDTRLCEGPERRLAFLPGPANRLAWAAFAFERPEELVRYRARVAAHGAVEAAASPFLGGEAFAVRDPEDNRILFGASLPQSLAAPAGVRPARLQHFALRTRQPEAMRAFYRDTLGFVVSDSVYDDEGKLRACFVRADAEHHTLALFHADAARHDHLSMETADWTALRDWADRVAGLGTPIAWGIGRHGPGNDTFFMVRDPDDNLAEISAELEQCAPGRPEGRWKHEQRTLNLWGSAIMRS